MNRNRRSLNMGFVRLIFNRWEPHTMSIIQSTSNGRGGTSVTFPSNEVPRLRLRDEFWSCTSHVSLSPSRRRTHSELLRRLSKAHTQPLMALNRDTSLPMAPMSQTPQAPYWHVSLSALYVSVYGLKNYQLPTCLAHHLFALPIDYFPPNLWGEKSILELLYHCQVQI